MKIYKVNKRCLRFNEEITNINYKWDLPILIDKEYNVLLGSSLRNVLNDDVLVIISDIPDGVVESFKVLEDLVAKENDISRLSDIRTTFKNYLKSIFHPIEQAYLFDYKDEDTLVTEENYRKPGV